MKPSSRGAACANQSVSRSLSSATNLCLEILQSISLTGGFLYYGGFLEFSLFWSKPFCLLSLLHFLFWVLHDCTNVQLQLFQEIGNFWEWWLCINKTLLLKESNLLLGPIFIIFGEIWSFVFIDDYAYILNFRNPDNFPAILNIYRLNVKSKNQSCKCTFCEITSHCTKLSRSHLSG